MTLHLETLNSIVLSSSPVADSIHSNCDASFADIIHFISPNLGSEKKHSTLQTYMLVCELMLL